MPKKSSRIFRRESELKVVRRMLAGENVSALAREVAIIFKLDAYEGWTVRVVVFLLPGLEAYSTTPAMPPLPVAPATGATVMLEPPSVTASSRTRPKLRG